MKSYYFKGVFKPKITCIIITVTSNINTGGDSINFSDINIEPLPHQEKTARMVVEQLEGRALLADEVGLGKTIEAGLILKHYLNEGLLDNFLILVPASLGFQWTEEMVNKFNIKDIFFNRKGRGWQYFDYQIASLDKAKRERHARYLKEIAFDMVIVDEAHKLKNRKTLNWKFVNSLEKKFCLLLTATPLQNDIQELYNLISIIHPDLYSNFSEFKQKYDIDRHTVGENNKLQQDLQEIMIRNSHKQTPLDLSDRHIKQITVTLCSEERKIYDRVTSYVKKKYRQKQNEGSGILNLLLYQRELCSSFAALRQTLSKTETKDQEITEILRIMNKVGCSSKLKKTLEIIAETEGRVLIFTEFRATQNYIGYFLEENGHKTIVFNGSFSSSGKEYIKFLFQKDRDVMISTEAGSQGLNLQFCNVIINYDLPWNPMKLEQRIGRIHRLGQQQDVYVYNLATRNTIEEKVLKILYKKIHLLKKVIGDMDNVLMDLKDSTSLENNIMEIIAGSTTEQEIDSRLQELVTDNLEKYDRDREIIMK